MLIDFIFNNYLSFANETSFSMVASNTVKECEENLASGNNVWRKDSNSIRLLKSAAIYGANGSGKSTLVSAMADFRSLILFSFINDGLVTNVCGKYFRFSVDGMKKPISMQMIFMVNNTRYRLGFQLKEGEVIKEWLFVLSEDSIKESYCYKRELSEIKVNGRVFKGSNGVAPKTRRDSLFISTCAQFNVGIAMEIKNWFAKRFNILSGQDDTMAYTAEIFMHDNEIRENIIRIVNMVDTNIKGINVKESLVDDKDVQAEEAKRMAEAIMRIRNIGQIPQKLKKVEIFTNHIIYNGNETVDNIAMPFEIESLGTIRMFSFLGPWFDTLRNGGVLVIDEFGMSLHTKLSIELIKLFSAIANPHCAQLIITTHDTNILRKDLLRRDQIWFTEKSEQGVSDLYSLVEYKINQATSVRNDASFGKDYLLGRYGAIPYFGNIQQFIADYGKQEE